MNRSLLWVALVGLLATSAWGLDAPRNRPADDEEERPAGSARALQTLPDEAYQDENAAEEPEPEAAVEPAPKRPAPRPPVEEEDPTKLRFQRTTRIVMLGVEQEPASAPINPDNVLKLTRYEAQLHIRPDFTLKNDEYEFMFKPRAVVNGRWISDGMYSGTTNHEVQVFVNEWLARARVMENLFASYGRENLQWGPAILVSCSNPFLVQNGRSVPQVEVPGMDYGRLVWVPDQTWTASFIANMTQGPVKTFGNFEKTYAVKLDWTGHRKNASVIASSTERRSNELGFFGVWNATDPLLVYTEGRVAEAWDTSMLVGGSYTLDSSAMITVEGFYDRYGTVPLVENLPSRWQILNGVWRPMVSTKVLMAQYNSGTRYRKFNFNLRADHILGDGTRGMAFTNYALGNSLELWSVGIINGGAEGTRFRLYTDHVSLLGMTYTF